MADLGSSLLKMKLFQDISNAASKEFALEKAMAKMKGEWENVRFNCQPYRESGVSILSGVDDIQVFRNGFFLNI